VWLGGWVEIPVYRLDALLAGHEVKGPALFESPTTTVLLGADERAEVTPSRLARYRGQLSAPGWHGR
jgi:N-methylhydantoinase A/oxoprolinase/acetone carboxylase beta subunit